MLPFKDWLQRMESTPTTRVLSQPWAYPALAVGGNPFAGNYSPRTTRNYRRMVRRDSKKKRQGKPSHGMDDFVREMELLKTDLERLAAAKRKDKSGKGEDPKPVAAEVDEDLVRTARTVLSHLKHAPDYYAHRSRVDGDRADDHKPKKVSRQDASKIAKDLGVDFAKSKFTAEVFRKGIEAELGREERPSAFDRNRERLADMGADPVGGGVAGDRLGDGD